MTIPKFIDRQKMLLNERNPSAAPVVVTVGDELVLGERLNENACWMAEWLKKYHQPACIQLSLPDDIATIADWICTIHQRGHFPILVAGGIGGTHDDCTRAGIAKALDVQLVRHPECWKILSGRYGGQFNESRQNMALLPDGSSLIQNPHGAPGFELDGIYAFPGFPNMLKEMLPSICKDWGSDLIPRWREVSVRLKTREGDIADAVRQFSESTHKCRLGIYPHSGVNWGEVTLRFRCPESQKELENLF